MRANNIGDRGGGSLAEALRINKGLEVLDLLENELGKKSIEQLIDSLQRNNTLRWMLLPYKWKEFSQNCVGYNQAETRLIL